MDPGGEMASGEVVGFAGPQGRVRGVVIFVENQDAVIAVNADVCEGPERRVPGPGGTVPVKLAVVSLGELTTDLAGWGEDVPQAPDIAARAIATLRREARTEQDFWSPVEEAEAPC